MTRKVTNTPQNVAADVINDVQIDKNGRKSQARRHELVSRRLQAPRALLKYLAVVVFAEGGAEEHEGAL